MAEQRQRRHDEQPDSAMASGSDEGTPGQRLSGSSLSAEERAMLADLTARAPHVVDPVEDTIAASYAVEDDAPLPSSAPLREGESGDADTPQFREP